jgi:sugar phosphate isomerase/epimerase
VANSLDAIEWGSDVHLPTGQLSHAKEVASLTADNGLQTSAYGSYFRLGAGTNREFSLILETALALGAPTVRIWAGTRSSKETSALDRISEVRQLNELGKMAKALGLSVSLELHGGTLNDCLESSIRLFQKEVEPDLPIFTFWQTLLGKTPDEHLSSIGALGSKITNLHVFNWGASDRERFPLSQAKDEWIAYLKTLQAFDHQHFVSLEFLPNDDPALLARESVTLRSIIQKAQS